MERMDGREGYLVRVPQGQGAGAQAAWARRGRGWTAQALGTLPGGWTALLLCVEPGREGGRDGL